MKKHCLECGEAFAGRSDKKFCSDQCRTSFNNRLNKATHRIVRSVNAILRSNRKILLDINRTGKTTVSIRQLVARGFDFRYFTNIHTTRAGKIYYFCYDQGYLPLGNGHYVLVRRR
ncbi:MAG: DUF2116 family Zn-ribbon domain-containing protein [Solitalea sp.]